MISTVQRSQYNNCFDEYQQVMILPTMLPGVKATSYYLNKESYRMAIAKTKRIHHIKKKQHEEV